MTRQEHIAVHVKLHRAMDELLADFITHNKNKYPSKTTLVELMHWSNRQTDPDTIDPDGNEEPSLFE